tara:strand:- start:138 stop:1019 length:882 start_codon:yes stop_codon:yes gene_type:complete
MIFRSPLVCCQAQAELVGTALPLFDENIVKMASRASSFLSCTQALRNDQAREQVPGMIAATTGIIELHLCLPIKWGFVHIFKSAGSTISGIFRSQCAQKFGFNASLVLTGPEGCIYYTADCPGLNQTLLHHFTWFTFVRNTHARLASGIFEEFRRGHLQYLRDMGSPDAVVGKLMESCIRSISSCPAHLHPQVSFLADRSQPFSNVRFIGRVETIVDELPHLLSFAFSDEAIARRVRALLLGRKERDIHSPEYANGELTNPLFNFNATRLDLGHLAMVNGAFLVDVVCIDLVS